MVNIVKNYQMEAVKMTITFDSSVRGKKRRIRVEKSLAIKNPSLAAMWHPTKNHGLTPFDVSTGSEMKVWWLCEQGHEFEGKVHKKNEHPQCKECLKENGPKNKVTPNNCLTVTHPEIAKEWHPTLNNECKPNRVRSDSDRKVFLKCKSGHIWKPSIKERVNGKTCPDCEGIVDKTNSLATVKPKFSKEWHPSLNKKITPDKVSVNSDQEYWWVCKNGHEFRETVANRGKKHCPKCNKKLPPLEKCLAVVNPELAEQWDYELNYPITPWHVFAGTADKQWWRCLIGHTWKARVLNRNHGRGCPFCNSSTHTSFPEQVFYYYFKRVFPLAENGYKMKDKDGKTFEFDLYVPDVFRLEYDGGIHFKKKAQDENKNAFCQEGIPLIRIREKGLPEIKPYNSITFIRDHYYQFSSLKEMILKVRDYLLVNSADKFDTGTMKKLYEMDNIRIEVDANEIIELIRKYTYEHSFEYKHPNLAKEWHPTKNGRLKPSAVTAGCNWNVWWICPEGDEYESSPHNRSAGKGCSYCANKKANERNSLATVNPKLAAQWHYEKNYPLTPDHVVYSSNKEAWWICDHDHVWKGSISGRQRAKSGVSECPECKKQRLREEGSLGAKYPQLAKQWNYEKNKISPFEVHAHSNKKFWWICEHNHERESTVSNRTRYAGTCYYCDHSKTFGKSTDLAKYWDYEKNYPLTPLDISYQSNKKAWFKCENGHERKVVISSLKGKFSCPECKSVAFLRPDLLKQWHYKKNGYLDPTKLGLSSKIVVWWICEHECEWEDRIFNRARQKQTCPCPK